MGKYDIDDFAKWFEDNIDFDDPTTHFTRLLCNEIAEANRLKRLELSWKYDIPANDFKESELEDHA